MIFFHFLFTFYLCRGLKLPALDKAIGKVTRSATAVVHDEDEFLGDDNDIGAEVEVLTDNTIIPTNVQQKPTGRKNTRAQQMQNLKEASVVIEKLSDTPVRKEVELTPGEIEEKELENRMNLLMWGKNAAAVNTSKKKKK